LFAAGIGCRRCVGVATSRRRRGFVRRHAGVAQITSAEDAPPKAKEFCKKGKRVEVLAPSKRWREAQVVKVHPDGATVHFVGYDSQFDERISFNSGRLRPFGGLRSERLGNLRSSFVLQGDARSCPGCGVPLQSGNPRALGYIPADKLEPEEPVPLHKTLTLEDEVKLLLQEDGVKEQNSVIFPTRSSQTSFKVTANIYLDIRKEPRIDAERQGESLVMGNTFEVCEIYRSPDARTYFRLADGRGWVFDWAEINGARTQLIAPVDNGVRKIKEMKKSYQKVCQRCWSLWQYNDCDEIFRPGFGQPAFDELTAESFKEMLSSTLAPVTKGCVLAVVDVFDFGPSSKMLRYLARQLRGKKGVCVRIVANKIDLLPVEVNLARIRGWVAREAQEAGLSRVKLTDVFPISCHKGKYIKTVARLLESADAATEFYVVGAANAGKSSLLNRLALQKRKGAGQLPAQAADGFMVSALPGTTMRPLTVKYQRGRAKLVDTPGLLVPGNLAERLTLEDVKEILPQTGEARRVTLHVEEGKTILVGALARLDMVEGKPFQYTVFTSERVKLHRTLIRKAESQAERFAGERLTPPMSKDRFEALKPWTPRRFELEGAGWDEACADIVFHGLGWISLTGCGRFVVEAHAPEGVDVTVRPPLMPFEAKWTGVRYVGHPGWFKIGKYTTRGNDAGRIRRKLRGQKF